MVLAVCRQMLYDPNDVDDAFQATFIVLARRASSLRRRELLGNWLHGVAYRVARRARSLALRREARISRDGDVSNLRDGRGPEPLDPETCLKLHEEVRHLPDRYRIPVVLCYFEGLTHEEAAEQLQWPIGSVKGRLARARELLRNRLVRHGVGLSASILASSLDRSAFAASVPPSLQVKAIRSALLVSGESVRNLAASTAISLSVATIAQGVIRTMVVSQLRTVLIPAVIGVGIVSSGASVVAFQYGGGTQGADAKAPASVGNGGTQGGDAKSPTRPDPGKTPAPSASGGNKARENAPDPARRSRADDDNQMKGTARGEGGLGAILKGREPSKATREQIASIQRQLNLELAKAVAEADENAKTKAVLEKLESPISMDFGNETPLEDVLKYIQSATADPRYTGIPIYVDPVGLQEAEKTLQSPIQVKLDGIPLKTTLRLVLKQLGLAYCVHDGFLMISSPKGIYQELKEAKVELGIDEGVGVELEQALLILEGNQPVGFGGGGGFGGGMGGMGGGGMR
ncbi:MAG: hypothetical protein ABS79_02135 [Planctomycetes bacterium SCN 63-9]|nr:MAG: hypothetical protein ABS79_02135 [Planctomycetes bacterium SCN 63-9]